MRRDNKYKNKIKIIKIIEYYKRKNQWIRKK